MKNLGTQKYTIIETFVGAGGSHIGFKKLGFKSLFVNDIDNNALKTLLHNNPDMSDCTVSNESIIELNGDKILRKINKEPGEVDVIFGGIVCKGFSLAGEKSPNDPRNFYYRYQLELVNQIRPKISIIENVPGILNAKIISPDTDQNLKNEVDELWQKLDNYKGKKATARKSNLVDDEMEFEGKNLRDHKKQLLEKLASSHALISVREDILNIFEKIGYKVYVKTLNSAWYRSATKRDRVIIVAVRNDIDIPFIFPLAKIENATDYKTVGDALNEIKYKSDDLDNVPMNHSDKTVARFKYVGEGENLAKKIDRLPDELKISKFYSRGSTMRLDSKKSSPTLVPGHSNFPIHPFEDRVMTVREAATITGFPLDYKFFGNHTKRCELVGNAVPPHLSQAIAEQCVLLLDEYYNSVLLVNQSNFVNEIED